MDPDTTKPDRAPDPTEAWAQLEQPGPEPQTFDTDTIDHLPGPARRWLARVVPTGTLLEGAVRIEMDGEIRVGPRWLRFRAEQILRPSAGFVWRAVVGGRVLRLTGADLLVGTTARMEFRLHGLFPVARATGDDVVRSAAARLAGETVLWAPHLLVPQESARWQPLDDERAVVTVHAAGEDVAVEVTVDADGQLRAVGFLRWNASAKPPVIEPFGGPVTGEHVGRSGVRVAGRGTGGWGWATPGWPGGEFFRYRIVVHRTMP